MWKKNLQSSQGEMQKKVIIHEVWSTARRNCYFKGDFIWKQEGWSSVLQAVFPVCDAGVAVAGVRTAQRNSYTPPFLLTSPGCFWNTFRRHGGLDTSFWRTCLAFLLLQLRLGRIVKLKNRRRINRRRISRNKKLFTSSRDSCESPSWMVMMTVSFLFFSFFPSSRVAIAPME